MIQGGRNRLLQVSQRPFHVGNGGSSGHKAPCPLLRPSLRRLQLPRQLLLLLLTMSRSCARSALAASNLT
jgi:hypothetical protein